MPTFNSVDYLSLPQQVSKNKGDIANHEGRIVVLENAIIGNTSVVMTDPITIASLGVDYALTVASANAIKTIVTYNYNNPDNYQMFGAQVVIPAAIVNDYITFPDVTDVAYDVVFEIQAKQELDPVTESYSYIAQGESPEFRFTIFFAYRFDIGAYTSAPVIRVERLNDQNNLLVVEGNSNEFAFTFEQDTTLEGANFTGTITIWGKSGALLPYTLLNTSRVNLIDDDSIRAMTIGTNEMAITGIETVVPNTHNITISLVGHIGLNTMWKVAVQADDERKLTIGDPSDNSHPRVITYDLTTVVTNAISDHTNITAGIPYTASKYSNKDFVRYYKNSSTPFATLGNVTGAGITFQNSSGGTDCSISGSLLYKPGVATLTTGTVRFQYLKNNSGGPITLNSTTAIVSTLASAGNVASAVGDYAFLAAIGLLQMSTGTSGSIRQASAILVKSGVTFTITIIDTNAITVPDTGVLTLTFINLLPSDIQL